MKKIFLLMLALITSAFAFAYSILESQSGYCISNSDARSAAMGSAGTAGSLRLFDGFLNPANLSLLPHGLGFQAGMSVVQDSDNRTLPMYNSFDAYSGDATYASNVNYFNDYSAGVGYRYGLQAFSLSAALAWQPLISFDADYFEDVRNNANANYNLYPPTLARNYINSDGLVGAISFLAAFEYQNLAAFGLEVSSLSGDASWERRINWSDQAVSMMLASPDSLVDSFSKLERKFSGMLFKFGLLGKLSDRVSVGFSYQPQIDFEVSGTLDGLDVRDAVYMYYSKLDSLNTVIHTDSIMYSDYVLPSRMRFGLSYAPQNIMKTYFNADVEYVAWSQQNKFYDDQFNFYVGVEHILPNTIPVRLGFNYTSGYSLHEHGGLVFADKVVMPAFTAGTGFNLLGKFIVDVSLEYGNRQYEALDLFMDSFYDYQELWANYQYLNLQDRGWENPDTVKETLLQLKTSVTYRW